MKIAELIFILLLAAAAIAIYYRSLLTMRAARWQQLTQEELMGSCESIGFIGCSIITHDIFTIKEIEPLLSSAYQRYELIVLLNGLQHRSELLQIIKHYHLTRVNHTLPHDNTSGVNSLYRSTCRTYRRLVVMDCSTTDIFSAINTAINFASYDYIIPLQPHTALLPHAIERIATTLSDSAHRDIELIYNDTLAPCCVFQRDGVISHEGITPNIIQRIPKKAILRSDTALTYRTDRQHFHLPTLFFCASILLLGIGVAYFISIPAALAYGLTWGLATIASIHVLRQWSAPDCSVGTILYQIRNLTIFFRQIKFNIS